MLHVPLIQKKISIIALNELYKTLGVPVEIGEINFKLFNGLIIKDLYLEDQQGETLFQAKRLEVNFDFFPLLSGKFRLSSAQLFSFDLNLIKENDDSPINLQFVMDAFANKDSLKKESKIDLVIKNLNLRRGNFTFNVKNAQHTHGKFNSKHLNFSDIFAKIQLHKLTDSELAAGVDRLSFKEQSGLIVKKIAFDLIFSTDSANIKKFEVQLPNSSLLLENIAADFKEVSLPSEYIGNSHIALQITPSKICLQDLSAFVPAFVNYKDLLTIQGNLSGKLEHLKLNNFSLFDSDELLVQADVQLKNLSKGKDLFILGKVKKSFIKAPEIARIANNFSGKSIDFPEEIVRLGNIQFEGEISGYFRHITAFGLFNTDVGNLRTNIEIEENSINFIKGTIQSHDLNLSKIFQNDDYGMANFDISVEARHNSQKKYDGIFNAHINNIEFMRYTYENIDVKGNFTENSFNGTLDINSPEGKLTSKGFVQLNGNKSIFNFWAQVEQIKLDKLNLSKKYKDSDLSFDVHVDFTGNNIDNLLGYVNVKDIKFNTEQGRYYLETLMISSKPSGADDKILAVESDLVNGNITGQYSFKDILPALLETGNNLLPALVKTSNREIMSETDFSVNFIINDTNEFSYMLDLPFILYGQTKIQGHYNHKSDKFKVEISAPQCSFKKMSFKDCAIMLENQNNHTALLSVNATNTKNDKSNKIHAIFNIADNMIHSKLIWNDKQEEYNGTFNVSAEFIEQTGAFPLKTEINLLESTVTFRDSTWNINPSEIVMDSAKIKINHLDINHSDQYVKVNGIISQHSQDSLQLALNKVNLDYIFDILNLKSFELGGIVSGYATANNIYHTQQLSAQLKTENFSFNNTVMGDLNLSCLWNDEQQGIQLLGDIHNNDSSSMTIDGIIFPIKETLDLKFNAIKVDAAFLRRYLNGVAKNISGEITGNVNLYGDFSNVTLVGEAFVKDGSFGIEFLNTSYTFSDYIYLKPNEISINNATFYDKFGKKASVNGFVKHKFLSNFEFSANINPSNFLVFNATERYSPNLYGSAFGTGSVAIKGNESLINFDIKLQSDEKTKITLNFMEQSDIAEYNFINFVSKKETVPFSITDLFSQVSNKPIVMHSNSGTELNFNLQLTATPAADVEIIMDPNTGDKIKGYGHGNIRIQYGTKSPLKLFGEYTIEKGVYNFSFQQALYRDFQIRDGSSISFNGDPNTATLDINAIYSLSANVSDLNEGLAQDISRTNIPVNCVLNITGGLERPDIKFDIETPNSGADIERQIKAIINTDEMMNRQIIYLLVLNKFYTQEATGSTTQRSNELTSLAASTLSSQLTSLLGSFNKNFQIGTMIFTNSDNMLTDSEVALILSGQLLNKRLIINGNFGYRNNLANTNFIGDFDAEYKITPLGDIRLKAYNHYNDRFYSLRSVYTTQGIGLLFRKDFNNFMNLIRKKTSPDFALPVTGRDSTTSQY